MKKACILLLVALMFGSSAATAQESVNIVELAAQTPAEWQQTYEAHGRTIEIDVPIEIPDVDTFPVLIGAKRNSRVSDELVQYYETMEHTFEEVIYWNSEMKFTITVNNPTRSRLKKGSNPGFIYEHDLDLRNCDWNSAYAEENDMTLQEAWKIFCTEFDRCYGKGKSAELFIKSVVLEDICKIYDKSGEAIEHLTPKGNYCIECAQKFHNIPVLATISYAYHKPVKNSKLPLVNLLIRGNIADEDSFSLYLALLQEEGILYEDVPLCSFSRIQEQLEERISAGILRDIYTLRLGYVGFSMPDDDEAICFFPCWIVEGAMYASAKEERKANTRPNDPVLSIRHQTDYATLFFNAQTGEMFDPASSKKDRLNVPQIITY
ncbi:MAG: hypothetical protein MRZ54_00060 [Clostridiales bacterium]|nr:hypothetical protein [Clostridiales bacterium]